MPALRVRVDNRTGHLNSEITAAYSSPYIAKMQDPELEANPHPYACYNKEEDAKTLVGNWVEEKALQDMTGLTRYEVSLPHMQA